jgi:hypothetical protein
MRGSKNPAVGSLAVSTSVAIRCLVFALQCFAVGQVTQAVTDAGFVIVKGWAGQLQAVDAGRQGKQNDFEFKAFGGDGMNGLGQEPLNETTGSLNLVAVVA